MSKSAFVQTCLVLAAIFWLAGAALLGYADTLPRFTDAAAYSQQSAQLPYRDSAAFHKLRLDMLSPKDALHDYGWSLVAAGVFALWAGWRKELSLHTPKSPWTIVALAFVLPLLHGWSARFELDQSFLRGEFPTWADTLAIPMMSVPILVVLMLLWHLGHLVFMSKDYRSVPLAGAMSLRANWWLLAVTAGATAMALHAAWWGQYWNAIPMLLSAYFTLCLAAWARA